MAKKAKSYTIGQKIAMLRAYHGMTQTALGAKINKKHSTISEWERGKHDPTTEELRALGNAFKIHPFYFLDNVKPRPAYIITQNLDMALEIGRLPHEYKILLRAAVSAFSKKYKSRQEEMASDLSQYQAEDAMHTIPEPHGEYIEMMKGLGDDNSDLIFY